MLGKNLSALMNEDTILYYLNIYRGHIYREYPSGHITKADPADVIQARGGRARCNGRPCYETTHNNAHLKERILLWHTQTQLLKRFTGIYKT